MVSYGTIVLMSLVMFPGMGMFKPLLGFKGFSFKNISTGKPLPFLVVLFAYCDDTENSS